MNWYDKWSKYGKTTYVRIERRKKKKIRRGLLLVWCLCFKIYEKENHVWF